MKFYSRQTRRTVSPKRRTAKPRLELLDERQLLSGFGPADGAYISEPWGGSYDTVQIQPFDQKIVAAGDEGEEVPVHTSQSPATTLSATRTTPTARVVRRF